MAWRCFLMADTDRCRRWLRTYESLTCEGRHYCNAETPLPDGEMIWTLDGAGKRSHWSPSQGDVPADAAWPTHCEKCGREFGAGAVRHIHADQLFLAPDGTEHTLRDMPVGAIWRVEWHEGHWVGPDGKCYCVQLPSGGLGDQWIIEQPAQGGGHWTRTGEAPNFTCSPSILTPHYHGYLQGGILTDDLDGRTYSSGE